MAKAIISNARSVILVADGLKFRRSAPVRIGDMSQVDFFVTDKLPPPPFLDYCARHDVRIEVVQVAGGEE